MILDLTSGGRTTYVLGPHHPALVAAHASPSPDAATRLVARLEQLVGGLAVQSFHPSAAEARRHAVAVARTATGRQGLIECRGASTEPGSRLVSHGDGLQIEAALKKDAPAAFLVEVVQFVGGVRVPPPGYFERVRAACDATTALLVVDETTVGFGRTGTLLATTREKIEPDLLVVSFELMPGVSGGAVLARRSRGIATGDLTLDAAVASVALAAIDLLENEVLGVVKKAGIAMQKGIHELLETRRRWSLDTRGRGLVHALTLWEDPAPVLAACRERGLTITATGANMLLFTPPLVATVDDIKETLSVLDGVLAE
ncbi:MAG: aminotransferase class III-fold pyridoxal phosphate-dependent enzyme [Deltaproteobacteria bacterium]|nr:aminotransferase class III-fold pyridoxal phosphate-dependent enzyme [Deltaproteobacteria bacterium]